jgi:tetratricopeptide (TPR) repeat protein
MALWATGAKEYLVNRSETESATENARHDSLLAEAEAAFRRGDPAACQAACQSVLRARPAQPKALLLLGSSLGQQGRPAEALGYLESAAEGTPRNPDAHYALGMALTALRRWDEAAGAYRRVLGLAPRHAFAYNNLGVVLRESGALALAIACFREALAIEPGFDDAAGNLARALLEADRPADALPLAQALEGAAPGQAALGMLQARILRKLGRSAEAVPLLREVVGRNPGHADALYALGQAQKEAGRHEAAVETFTGVNLSGPVKARFDSAAGIALMELGRLEAARAAFERAVAADPAQSGAWLQLSGLRDFAADDPAITAMEGCLAGPELPERSRAEINFALGRALEGAGAHGRAFAHYLAGNAVMRARAGSEIDAVLATHEALRQRFSGPAAQSLAAVADEAGPQPIFIVGMPRSGTTLVEQILSGHPEVQGAGELKLLHEATLAVVTPYPDGLAGLGGEGLSAIAARYRKGLAKHGPAARFVTDKMPVNYEKLGLIAEAFPTAPIIHLRRDPLDSCLSCFATLFSRGQKFSYDLEELGRYYRLYEALMAHWRAVLPAGRLLDVAYEELVTDPEGQVRRLLDHCGLDWSTDCLRFHEQERPVLTASAAQVRRPLYSSSIGRWRRFEAQLQPLIKALQG